MKNDLGWSSEEGNGRSWLIIKFQTAHLHNEDGSKCLEGLAWTLLESTDTLITSLEGIHFRMAGLIAGKRTATGEFSHLQNQVT